MSSASLERRSAETVSPGVFGVPGQLPVEVLGTTGYY